MNDLSASFDFCCFHISTYMGFNTLGFCIATMILSISEFSMATASCLPSLDSCEFTLVIEERITMHWEYIRVKAVNGSLYGYDASLEHSPTKVPVDKVITMDGVHRAVKAFNNSVPGPPLIVYEGQQVIVRVHNALINEGVSIHFHGQHMKSTPFMDGVPYVSQCPINPGQSFTYKFTASPRGTHFYHSHVGGQRVDGLFGALIVKPKNGEKATEVHDVIMHVGDWFHKRGSALDAMVVYGNFKTEQGFVQSRTSDGVYFAPVIFKSAHIEGRGRYQDPATGRWTETPLTIYRVRRGSIYRFRIIGSGNLFPLRVSVDGHLLMAVASDGYDFQPIYVESVIVNPGERYDVIIVANQTSGNYWIRADSMEVGFPYNYARAILRYEDSTDEGEPSSNRRTCLKDDPCLVLNCQFPVFPESENSVCVSIDQLVRLDGDATPVFDDGESEEVFMNYIMARRGGVVNGKKLLHTSLKSLTHTQISDRDRPSETCDRPKCGNHPKCGCHHELKIPFNKTVQMVWTNQEGLEGARHHPIHLHGHAFHVLKIAYGKYNRTTGLKLWNNEDIECVDAECYETKWRENRRGGNKIPGLRTETAPQKDTLMIPSGAYAVVRFKSDNPGKWLLHCHIEFHAMLGMSMIINEAPREKITVPKNFPECVEYDDDTEPSTKYSTGTEYVNDGTTCTFGGVKNTLWFLISFLIGIVIIENCILMCCCVWRKKEKKHSGTSNSLINDMTKQVH